MPTKDDVDYFAVANFVDGTIHGSAQRTHDSLVAMNPSRHNPDTCRFCQQELEPPEPHEDCSECQAQEAEHPGFRVAVHYRP